MKALMVAIQPKWLKMILNGTKKFEFRNWKVPVGTVIYFYESKGKKLYNYGIDYSDNTPSKQGEIYEGTGKVVAKAVVRQVRDDFQKVYRNEEYQNKYIDGLTELGYSNQQYALELSQVEEIEPKDVTEFVSWSKLTKRVGKSKQAVLKLENNEFDLDRFHYDIMNYGTLRGRCKLIHPPQSRTWIYVKEEL